MAVYLYSQLCLRLIIEAVPSRPQRKRKETTNECRFRFICLVSNQLTHCVMTAIKGALLYLWLWGWVGYVIALIWATTFNANQLDSTSHAWAAQEWSVLATAASSWCPWMLLVPNHFLCGAKLGRHISRRLFYYCLFQVASAHCFLLSVCMIAISVG